MKKNKIFLLGLLLFAFAGNSFGLVEVKKWEPFEIRFWSENKYENPYVEGMPDKGDALVKVVFSGISGPASGLSYTLEGFWDGDLEDKSSFRVRFAPPAIGVWKYESFSGDPGMNGVKGEITCTDWTEKEVAENPTRRGQIQVCKDGNRAGRYFEYADGTPFLWIADIWSYWTKKGINLSSFQEVVNDRAQKGFTVGMMRFSANRRGVPLDRTCDNMDVNEMKRIDGMVSYANSNGLTVWILHWWGGDYIREEVGEQKMRRFSRYLVARLGAYNVVWIAAGEYNLDNYAGLGIDFWKQYGTFIKDVDPYKKRVLSIHHAPPTFNAAKLAPQWSTGELLHDEKWMDFNQTQVGHQGTNNERLPGIIKFNYSLQPAKPVICTESRMEFLKHTTPADYIRFAAWSSILSGAAGHTYGAGGIWIAHVPEAPANLMRSYDFDWYHKALDYPGGKSIGYLSKFFQGIEWWKLEPSQSLLLDNEDNYCATDVGNTYVVYLRHGGSAKVNLSSLGVNDRFIVQWFNPSNGTVQSVGVIYGGEVKEFIAPNDFEWVLHLAKG